MKLCMCAAFDIKNKSSWSGTPFSLFSALDAYSDNTITTINTSDYHNSLNLKINSISHCDFKESIQNRHLISKLGPATMNPLNSKILHKQCSKKDYDAVIEFGGFQPDKNLPPYYVYTDASHDLKLDYYNKYGYLPFGSENDSIESIKKASDYVKSIYQNAAGVFCMSKWLADSMINTTGVSPDKVHVVYAGANWHGVQLPKMITVKRIDKKQEIHLLLTGVSYYGKGVDIAIEAIKLLNNSANRKYYLHVCGIKEDIEDNSFIINHGFTDKKDLINILLKCDLFVLPTRFDCFGISFVEAMTFGLPCIGRNICAMPEIIDEGQNGELITSDDPKELAEKIEKICSDSELYASYSVKAIEKSKLFTWEKVADDMMRIIKQNT